MAKENHIQNKQVQARKGVHLSFYKVELPSANRNNMSRKIFKAYCEEEGFKPVGNTNNFLDAKGFQWAFTITKQQFAEARQFDLDCKGLVCLLPDGEIRAYLKRDLKIGQVTRTMKGRNFYSVKEIV